VENGESRSVAKSGSRKVAVSIVRFHPEGIA
jgi:hypothetical protein